MFDVFLSIENGDFPSSFVFVGRGTFGIYHGEVVDIMGKYHNHGGNHEVKSWGKSSETSFGKRYPTIGLEHVGTC